MSGRLDCSVEGALEATIDQRRVALEKLDEYRLEGKRVLNVTSSEMGDA